MLDEVVERGALVVGKLRHLRVRPLQDVDQVGLLGNLRETELQVDGGRLVEPGALVSGDDVDLAGERLRRIAGMLAEPTAGIAGLADIGRRMIRKDVAGWHSTGIARQQRRAPAAVR